MTRRERVSEMTRRERDDKKRVRDDKKRETTRRESL